MTKKLGSAHSGLFDVSCQIEIEFHETFSTTRTTSSVESRGHMRPAGERSKKNSAGKYRWISVFENGSLISSDRASSPNRRWNRAGPATVSRRLLQSPTVDRTASGLFDAQIRQQTIQRVVVDVEIAGELLDGLQVLGVVQGGLDGLG